MSSFNIYIQLGWKHLTDFGGYDHMLFLLALVAGYTIKDWKKITWLVTAFTISHSLALALSVLNIVTINTTFIEYGIIISIALLAIIKLITGYFKKSGSNNMYLWYSLVLFFGLIHGLGFSSYLKQIIGTQNLWIALLGFNLGLEIAQIVFVCLALATLTLLNYFIKSKILTTALTVVIAVWSIVLLITY
jgi:hypothetical protein